MVHEHIDTIDSLLARYVAGSLPVPARVLVESHLELSTVSRSYVRGIEGLAGDALGAIDPGATRMTPERKKTMLDAVFTAPESGIRLKPRPEPAGHSLFPNALRNFVGFDIDQVPWRTRLPGFREYDVGDFDDCHVSLFWIKPGRGIPAHTHKGCEISLVLDGAFSDAYGRYGRGDISVADDSIDHRPIAEKDRPCIGFAVVDAPLKFTGSVGQLLRDLIG